MVLVSRYVTAGPVLVIGVNRFDLLVFSICPMDGFEDGHSDDCFDHHSRVDCFGTR